MAVDTTKPGFPGPYLNQCKADDPMIKRVNMNKTEIGARSSGLPKDVQSSSMGISHVGGSAGK